MTMMVFEGVGYVQETDWKQWIFVNFHTTYQYMNVGEW